MLLLQNGPYNIHIYIDCVVITKLNSNERLTGFNKYVIIFIIQETFSFIIYIINP